MLPSPNDDSCLTNEFVQLAQAYSAFARKEGIQLAPYHTPELPFFSQLDAEKKREVIEFLRLSLEVFRSMAEDRFSLKDSSKLIWRAAMHMRLTPCSDIFDKIEPGQSVLILSKQGKILFYNLRFLELHNFSLEELHCTEWYRLSKRADWARQALSDAMARVYSGQIQETFDPGVARHVVEEVSSKGRARLWVEVKYLSPVKKNGQIAGVIGVQNVDHALPTDL